MKIFSTLAIVSLAVAALAVETTDATGHPVMKPVSLKKQSAHRPAKLVASDLNEGDEANTSGDNGDGLSDPFVGATFGVDDEAGPLVSSRDDSSSGSGESDGWNGSGSGSGVNEEGSFADEGSNEDSSMDGSGDADEDSSSDGSGVAAPATESSVVHHQLHSARHEESEWGLFDQESSVTSNDGSDGSNEDGESSSSGSNEDAEGSGSNGSNGSGEDTDADESPEEPVAGPAGFDGDGDLNGEHPHDGLKKSLAARQSEAAAKAAGQELATRASTESIGFQDAQRLAMIGSVVGAAIGAIAAVFGVAHLRRQQQRDEQSTLAAELPEPQTGREDGEFDDVSGGGEDELAASSIDLEEALTSEEETKENEEVEGTFV